MIWLAARLLFFLSELLCVKIGFMPFQFSNLLALIIALLWAAVLNNGVKYLPILPLAGGVFMLIRAFRERAQAQQILDRFLSRTRRGRD